jgi:hypothetical protein
MKADPPISEKDYPTELNFTFQDAGVAQSPQRFFKVFKSP